MDSKFKPPKYVFVEKLPKDCWCCTCRRWHAMIYEHHPKSGCLLRVFARCPLQNVSFAVMIRSREAEREYERSKLTASTEQKATQP